MRIGIYNCYWNTLRGGERYAGTVAEILSRHDDVELIGHEPVDLSGLSDALGLDLSRVRYRRFPPLEADKLTELTADYDLFINSTFWSNLASKATKSLYLVFFPQYMAAPGRLRLARGAGSRLRRWPGPARRLARRLDHYLRRHDRRFLQTYDVVLAISQYTQQWINEFWNTKSVVLPPPVDTDTFVAPDPSHKKRVILSVGRFFAGAHCKKHPAMLRAFRRMCDRGLLPEGWEFHLVGNVRRAALADLEYYAEVERLAQGYPVRLLPDLPFPDLLEEYRDASIFWHATGWGESERRHPEKMEHFGLTTCEAMSSGCVPVVIAKAGQLEIVRDGKSGFLFRNQAELISRTRQLAQGYGQPWILEMMARATDGARRYSMEAFEQKLLSIFERYLSE